MLYGTSLRNWMIRVADTLRVDRVVSAVFRGPLVVLIYHYFTGTRKGASQLAAIPQLRGWGSLRGAFEWGFRVG